MDWQDRISVDPKVLVGKPVIKGTRIAVELLMELLAVGWSHEQILKSYPHLTTDEIQAGGIKVPGVIKGGGIKVPGTVVRAKDRRDLCTFEHN
ncbi:MAG TPA: DUF433 domain-containing protein [Pirellulales bacterium]